RAGTLRRLHQIQQQLARPGDPDRPDLGLLPAFAVGRPPPGDGHRLGVRAWRQQAFRDPDPRRLGSADRGAVGLSSGVPAMSIGESATPLGKVRGLGSAREGGEHWLTERVTSIALLLLGTWLIAIMVLLPSLEPKTLVELLRSPSGAVPMALLIIVG